MGLVFGIESLNRKLALRAEVAGDKKVNGKHVGGAKYIGGFTRAYSVTTGSGKKEKIVPQYCFIRKYGRSSVLSVKEINNRNNFRAVSGGVKNIMEDLMVITRVQTMYVNAMADVSKKINGVSALGYATLRSWVFAVQYAGLKNDDQYDVDTFPQAFDA